MTIITENGLRINTIGLGPIIEPPDNKEKVIFLVLVFVFVIILIRVFTL